MSDGLSEQDTYRWLYHHTADDKDWASAEGSLASIVDDISFYLDTGQFEETHGQREDFVVVNTRTLQAVDEHELDALVEAALARRRAEWQAYRSKPEPEAEYFEWQGRKYEIR